MTIDMMKQWLEALECVMADVKTTPNAYEEQRQAIAALRTAIAEAEKQEAWKTSDTAYRPGGLPQDFIKHEVDSFDDWSEWVCPDPTQYFMKCCDCGLVHEMQFKVVKYSEGDECEAVDDQNVQAVFRARRTNPPTAQRQWVGLTDAELADMHATLMVKLRGCYETKDLYRAIEARLKERNT